MVNRIMGAWLRPHTSVRTELPVHALNEDYAKKEWYLTHLLKRFDSRNPFKALFHDEGQIECWESYEILKLIYIWDAEQRLQLMSI